MKKDYSHSIELIGGYKDKKGKFHRNVTFEKRPLVSDLILLDTDPQAKNPTQYTDLIRRLMITKFGTLKMPVPLPTLLSLDSIDRDDLTSGADKFLAISRGSRQGELLADNKVKLYFGFEIESVTYDIVTFGHRLIGKDEVEADIFGLDGLVRLCFTISKQICQLSNSESGLTLDCVKTADDKKSFKLTVDHFLKLDGEDFNLLMTGAEFFRQSFRFRGIKISGNENGKGNIFPDEGNGDEGR